MPTMRLLENIIEAVRPDILQLHGKESVARLRDIKARFRLPVMKVIAVATKADLAGLAGYAAVADRILFDAKAPKDATRPGGLGAAFDWHLLEGLDLKIPVHGLRRAQRRQCGGGGARHGRRRRPFVRRRKCAGREGSGKNPRVHARGACSGQHGKDKTGEWLMALAKPNSFRTGPDDHGHFGMFGGRYVAETLMPLILDLDKAYADAKADPAFRAEMDGHLKHYVGRPSPLYYAERLSQHLGGAKIYLKREELNHTGSHKVNNVLGQIMLAQRMGKKRIIAETGAGQHGVATATLCARFGLECIVYMGAVDVARQAPNVFRMEMLGAKVVAVQSGTRTLKDAMNEALRDWVTNVDTTYYCIGTVAGPHPYPMMVRDFQSIIGRETREQMLGARRPAAGLADRLHRRRLERDGPVPSVPRRSRPSRSSASRPRVTGSTSCTRRR